MFEQNPTLGPGTGTFANHSLEILLMLLGAFLLGLWLGWLLWSRYKALVDGITAERDSLQVSLDGLTIKNAQTETRLTQYEADNATLKYRIDVLSTENEAYSTNLEAANLELFKFRGIGTTVEIPDAEAEIPMEVIESPVDVHVESLVETEITDIAVTELVVETPSSESILEQPTIDEEAETPIVDLPNEVLVLPVLGYATEPAVVEAVVETTPEVVVETVVETPIETVVEPVDVGGYFAPSIQPDDLKIIEGIGPKIQQVLNGTGILTFHQLAETSAERLKEILVAAGSRYQMHDPASWPEQSRLAAEGQWNELKSYQSYLQAGRDTGAVETPAYEAEAPAIAETPIEEPVYGAETADEAPNYSTQIEDGPIGADDLKVIEGVGPKIAELLISSSISTFSALAATPVSRIKEILENQGPSFSMHDPGTWPAQALLASNGEWDNLKAYQGFLNAGKRPS